MDTHFLWSHSKPSDLGNIVSKDYVLRKNTQFQSDYIVDPGQFYHNILIDQQPGQFFGWFAPILDAIQYENMRILRMKMNFNYPLISNKPRIVVNINIG